MQIFNNSLHHILSLQTLRKGYQQTKKPRTIRALAQNMLITYILFQINQYMHKLLTSQKNTAFNGANWQV
jgi:hypothetical protein